VNDRRSTLSRLFDKDCIRHAASFLSSPYPQCSSIKPSLSSSLLRLLSPLPFARSCTTSRHSTICDDPRYPPFPHMTSHRSLTQSRSPSELSTHRADLSEKPAAEPPLPWFTESYFSRDPKTAAARKTYIIILALAGAVVILFAMAVLSIYWGSLWQTNTLVHNLEGWVVVSLASSLF
jgi:hypothetical protein